MRCLNFARVRRSGPTLALDRSTGAGAADRCGGWPVKANLADGAPGACTPARARTHTHTSVTDQLLLISQSRNKEPRARAWLSQNHRKRCALTGCTAAGLLRLNCGVNGVDGAATAAAVEAAAAAAAALLDGGAKAEAARGVKWPEAR
jgi:hypothetical protein